LKPRDDGFRRPDFAAFRRQLQDAVARKDEEAVLRIVDPGVAGGVRRRRLIRLGLDLQE
jgi:hypothetical protein